MLSNNLKKQAQLRESALAGIVILAMCYAAYANLVTPKQTRAKELKENIQKIEDKKIGIEKLNNALKNKHSQQESELSKQAQMAESLDPRIKMLKNQENSEYQSIHQFLNKITRPDFLSRINLTSLKYELPIIRKGYNETKFYIDSSGRFINVIEFLEKLESIPTLISLDKIDIKVNKDDGDKVSLDLNGTFYELTGNNND